MSYESAVLVSSFYARYVACDYAIRHMVLRAFVCHFISACKRRVLQMTNTTENAMREAAITKMVEHAMRVSLSDGYQWRDYMADLYDIARPTPSHDGVDVAVNEAVWNWYQTADKNYLGQGDGLIATPELERLIGLVQTAALARTVSPQKPVAPAALQVVGERELFENWWTEHTGWTLADVRRQYVPEHDYYLEEDSDLNTAYETWKARASLRPQPAAVSRAVDVDSMPLKDFPDGPLKEIYKALQPDPFSWANFTAEDRLKNINEIVVAALKANALQPTTRGGVPEGWQLVPVEPTEDMLRALMSKGLIGRSFSYPDGWIPKEGYRAMLSAAPSNEKGGC